MKKTALWGLAILTLCNLFNYMDRYLFNSIAPAIKRDFDLTNFEVGMLASIFGLIYIIACPLAGLLGDKYKRPRILGGTMIITGILATGLGAIITDLLGKRTHRAAPLVCAVSALISIPFLIMALFAEGETSLFVWLLVAETFLFLNTTPITLILLDSVKFDQRSVGMGFSVLAIHLFGDALSPAIVGWWADKTDILTACVTILPAGLVVTAIFWFICFVSQKKTVVISPVSNIELEVSGQQAN